MRNSYPVISWRFFRRIVMMSMPEQLASATSSISIGCGPLFCPPLCSAASSMRWCPEPVSTSKRIPASNVARTVMSFAIVFSSFYVSVLETIQVPNSWPFMLTARRAHLQQLLHLDLQKQDLNQVRRSQENQSKAMLLLAKYT